MEPADARLHISWPRQVNSPRSLTVPPSRVVVPIRQSLTRLLAKRTRRGKQPPTIRDSQATVCTIGVSQTTRYPSARLRFDEMISDHSDPISPGTWTMMVDGAFLHARENRENRPSAMRLGRLGRSRVSAFLVARQGFGRDLDCVKINDRKKTCFPGGTRYPSTGYVRCLLASSCQKPPSAALRVFLDLLLTPEAITLLSICLISRRQPAMPHFRARASFSLPGSQIAPWQSRG